MYNQDEHGVVYHIDIERLRRTQSNAIRTEIEKVDEQIKNAERDLLLVKTAEKALAQIQVVLLQMRGIAVEAAASQAADRVRLSAQLNALKEQIDRIVASATCGGVNLIDGSMGSVRSVIEAVSAALEI